MWKRLRQNSIMAVGIITLGLLLFSGAVQPPLTKTSADAEAQLKVIEPDGRNDILPEIDEFATFHIGDPWDMEEPSDLQRFRTHDSCFENERFDGGIFKGSMTRGDGSEYIMPLYAGAVDHEAVRIGRIGYNYPIDADHYRYLTFRMYSNAPPCRTGIVQWSEDDTRAKAVSGKTVGFYVPPQPCEEKGPGWEIYTFDLKNTPLQWGEKPWTGTIRELRIIPVGGVPVGSEVRMDWIRLTHENPTTARPYTIRWTGGAGQIAIYASRGDRVLDENDILIGTARAADGAYVWQTGGIEAGVYHVYITDGDAGSWSAGPIILNSPPVAEIKAPSMTSGPEYAATKIGNPWDMNSQSDINLNPPPPFNICMDQIQFSDGAFHARTPRCPPHTAFNDPMIFLGGMDRYPPGKPDPEVDTSRYRYLSFRMFMEGEQNVPLGWVARFYWWKANATDNGVVEQPTIGRAVILQEGWNTYKMDLTAKDAVDPIDHPGLPWTQAHPNRLRLDPNELLPEWSPGRIHLDWVKLTAMDEVKQGQPYTIVYNLSKDDVAVQIYYDTDKDPTNGRKPIRIYAPDTLPPGKFRVFLPIALGPPGGSSGTVDQIEGKKVQWDTSNLKAGQYWICLEANDGHNTTTWCSEAPIRVK